MEIISKISDLQARIVAYRAAGKQIGLVPTMGALHNGHLSLVKRCVNENGCCVVSVFVNPTQFNDKNDLIHYPRTPEADCELLKSAGCHIVFMPSVEEMYPQKDTRVFDLGPVAAVMEGKFRPGHFNGVAQIVSKLFRYRKTRPGIFRGKRFSTNRRHQRNDPTTEISCRNRLLSHRARSRRYGPEQPEYTPLSRTKKKMP